jgi:hypothetical protein
MTQYSDPYLNELQKRIDAYSAKVPKDDQEARSISLMVGKLVMQIEALKGTKP